VVVLYRGGEVAIVAAYYVVNWLISGATLAMRAWRLRVVSQTGKRLKLSTGPVAMRVRLFRVVAGRARRALAVCRSRALALHDRLSRTRVVHLAAP